VQVHQVMTNNGVSFRSESTARHQYHVFP